MSQVSDSKLLRAFAESGDEDSFGPSAIGWQLPITDAMIDSIPTEIEAASMCVAPKRTGD